MRRLRVRLSEFLGVLRYIFCIDLLIFLVIKSSSYHDPSDQHYWINHSKDLQIQVAR